MRGGKQSIDDAIKESSYWHSQQELSFWEQQKSNAS